MGDQTAKPAVKPAPKARTKTQAATRRRTRTEPRVEQPRQWHVVPLDDDDHSYEYVIVMMMELFAKKPESAFKVAERVDADGRAVCITTHKEHAELKREQIQSYGKDPLIASCAGSMTAVLEPADFDPDDNADGGAGDGGSKKDNTD